MSMQGLRPVGELAAGRPHGDRLRYMAGCRCAQCRGANTGYEKQRAAARKAGDWNGLVRADRARNHMAALSALGVGRRQVSDASGVADSILSKVITGARVNIRARSERAVLAVTVEAAADHAIIDAGPTWTLLDDLLATGYSKAHLARALGYKTAAIQIKRTQCTTRTAFEVQRLHAQLARVPAAQPLHLVALLRTEGYRESRIHALVQERAAAAGLKSLDLNVYRGFVSIHAAKFMRQLHDELIGEPA